MSIVLDIEFHHVDDMLPLDDIKDDLSDLPIKGDVVAICILAIFVHSDLNDGYYGHEIVPVAYSLKNGWCYDDGAFTPHKHPQYIKYWASSEDLCRDFVDRTSLRAQIKNALKRKEGT